MLGAAVLVPVKSGLSLHEHFKCAAFTAHKVHSGCASFLDLGRKKRRRLLSKSAALRDAKGMLPCGNIPFVAWLFNF
jgi:hypothetical protein